MPTFCQPTIFKCFENPVSVPSYSVNGYLITEKEFEEAKRRRVFCFLMGHMPFAKSYKTIYLPQFFRLEIMPSTSEHSSPGQEALASGEIKTLGNVSGAYMSSPEFLLCLSQFDNVCNIYSTCQKQFPLVNQCLKKKGGSRIFSDICRNNMQKSIPLII